MSWGTCYSGSNNIHGGYPPIMADGRNFANWQPGAVINQNIKDSANIQSNWNYRNYLINNAESIMSGNLLSACDQCCYCPAKYGVDQPTNSSPFLYSSCTDNINPYGYSNSDLKNHYISEYKLQSRMVAPILTQDQYITNNYPRAN